MRRIPLAVLAAASLAIAQHAAAQAAATATTATPAAPADRATVRQQLIAAVDARAKLVQVMNDTLFSFGELGFQEVETSKYLTGLLEKNGFKVQRGIAGIPTAWVAEWGEGGPLVALGSDLDGIPQASQKPGVAYHDPLVPGAPGHGEGHNSGQVVNIVAALAVKDHLQKNRLPGRIRIWPGVAEELLSGKAWLVRDGWFKGVDAVLFSHVANNLGASWGGGVGTGMVSVRYDFLGESAHSGFAPWRGRSALDAVELMSVGWNYRREHLRLSQRSHSVIPDGGAQPNVVPPTASSWYYFRETDYANIRSLWETGDRVAQGASLMTDTKWSSRVLGSAWPGHFNKAMAERSYEHARLVGLPKWSEADVTLAKAIQRELKAAEVGLETELQPLRPPPPPESNTGGGSDDIGDVSWNVPTITLRYPANIPNLPGHHWANAISMATPIAHKGIVAGAKVQALNLFDLLTDRPLLDAAWDYFRNVQTKDVKYEPLIRPQDQPPVDMNREVMERYRPAMRRYYYDASKYDTYLDQLGIRYPTVR